MADELTVLTETRGRRATKLLRRASSGAWLKEDYDDLKYFTLSTAPVADVRDLHRELEKLRGATSSIVIRGAAHNDIDRQGVVQRKLENFGGTRGATPRHWVLLDFDKVEAPDFIDLVDHPEGAIEWLIGEHLPECWQDVSCVWRLSASAGTADGVVSAHLWFYLSEATCGGDLADYFSRFAPSVDLAPVRNDVQPHFVADTVFKDCADPLPLRFGFLELGSDTVELPPFDAAELRHEARELGMGTAVLEGIANVDGALELLGDGDGLAGFHAPLLKAVWLAVTRSPLVAVDSTTLKAKLREAINGAPKRRGRDVQNYLSDAYLDNSIQGAIRRRGSKALDVAAPLLPDAIALSEAGAQVRKVVEEFFTEARQGELLEAEPHVVALKATPGVGKTQAVLDAIAQHVDLARVRVVYSLPEHKLAAEIRARAPEGTRVQRGRSRKDDNGDPMCHDLERVEAVGRTTGNVKELVCNHCPHWGECGWSKQSLDDSPGLILRPHNYLFDESKADILIVDEDFVDKALRDSKVAVEKLTRQVTVPSKRGIDEGHSADLNAYRSKLAKALEDGLTLTAIRAAGITEADARHAKGLEHQRADAFSITPEMGPQEIERAWENFSARDARSWAGVWSSLEQQLATERDELHGFRRGEEGPLGVDTLTVSYSAEVRTQAPHTFVMDGTLSHKIIERFWPLAAFHDFNVEIPDNVEVIQTYDTLNGKRALSASGKAKVEKLYRTIAFYANGHDGLVITHKDTEELLTGRPVNDEEASFIDALGVPVLHFGKLRGTDDYKYKDLLIIAGRSQPSAEKIIELAEAIFFKDDVPIERSEYGKTIREYRTTDGPIPVETDALVDERAEAVRWMKCEGELLQAIHRLRPIRRTESIKIIIATKVPLPIRVSRLTTWRELVPSREREQMSEGVWLESAKHRSQAFGTTYISERRATSREVPDDWVRVEYALEGRGSRPAVAHFSPDVDAMAWLRDRLGVLRRLAVIDAPPIEIELEEQILQAIEQHGLSQEILANIAGISRPHLTNFIRGTYRLSDAPQQRLIAFIAQLGPPDQGDLFT